MSNELYIHKFPVLASNETGNNKEKYDLGSLILILNDTNTSIPIMRISNGLKNVEIMESYLNERDILYVDMVIADIITYDMLNSSQSLVEEVISHFEIEEDDGSVLIEIRKFVGLVVCSIIGYGIDRWNIN